MGCFLSEPVLSRKTFLSVAFAIFSIVPINKCSKFIISSSLFCWQTGVFMEIGKKIKDLRIQKNLTQEELADRCELSKGFISQLERDLTSPSIATLIDILQCLGTDLKHFFNDSDDDQISFKETDYFEKTDKYEFIRRVTDFYVKNKVLLISEDEISAGYKEMGDIDLSLAEESLFCDNECNSEYENYLLSNINFRKGAGLSAIKCSRYGKKYRHDQTR